MGFMSRTLFRIKYGRAFDWIKMQSGVKSVSIRKDDEKIVDIEGSVEIYPSMLKDGELPFKIGKLTGDFICYCREFQQSIIPDEIEGKIVFRNQLLGSNTVTTKFGIGDRIYFISENEMESDIIKEIQYRIFYADKMRIEKEGNYMVMRLDDTRIKESDAFSSPEELQNSILKGENVKRSGYTHEIKYSVGDEVWFLKSGRIYCDIISEVEIEVKEVEEEGQTSKEESNCKPVSKTSVVYKVDIDENRYDFVESQLFDNRIALANSL